MTPLPYRYWELLSKPQKIGKKMFLVLFSLEKCIFSTLKHPFWLVSLWYFHSCIPGEILTYFDPLNSSVGPKLMFSKSLKIWKKWSLEIIFLELQVSVGNQNRSDSHQEHNYENTKVKWDKMDALKLKNTLFEWKRTKKHFFPNLLRFWQ